MTTHTYTVPTATPPHTAAYLRAGELPGQIEVRLDSPTNPVAHTFTNTDGMDVINAGTNPNFLFVDQVPAALKPFPDFGGDFGLKVEAGTGATLRIEAPVGDDNIFVNDSSATNTSVFITSAQGQSFTRMGAGVSNLTIRTSDFVAQAFFPNGGTDVTVPFLANDIHLRVETGLGTYDRIFLGTNNSIAEEVIVKTGAGNCIVNLQGANGDDQSTAIVDFGSGPLGKGNKLVVFSEGLAKLAPVDGGTHTVVVDEMTASGANATERGGVIVTDDATVGLLSLANNSDAIIRANATVNTFTVAPEATVSVEAPVSIGAFTVDGTVDFTSTSAGSTVTEFATTGHPFFSTGEVNVNSGAAVTVLTSSTVGTLNIPGTGTLTMQPHIGTSDPARSLTVGSLFMGNNPSAPSGKLDLTDNGLIVDYFAFTPPSPHDYIRSLIVSAYNSGAWTGNGITSSTAAAQMNRGVGYAEATEIFSTFPATFLDRSVDSDSVLVRYTLYGDTNLDAMVNLTDFNALAANFGLSGRWVHGDSTYDGLVNLADFNALAANFGKSIYDPDEEEGGEGLMGGDGFNSSSSTSSGYYTYDELWDMLMNWHS